MSRSSILVAMTILSVVLGLAHIAYYHPQLPETVATHFNGRGEADGFSSRNTHSLLMAGIQIGLTGMFFGIGYLIRIMPTNLINVPNREYWFSDERKEQTVIKIRDGMFIVAIGTQLFLIGINHVSTMYNLGKPMTGWFWPLIGLYLVFTIGFCIWMSIQFRVPSDHYPATSET